MDYPDVSTAAIDVTKKKILVINGILNTIYSFDDIKEEMIIVSFGAALGGGIIRLCKALNEGQRLTVDLLKTLEVKEDDRCIEELLED